MSVSLVEVVELPKHHQAVYQRLAFLWGSKECRLYLTQLLSVSHGEKATTFSPAEGSEIFQLLEYHDCLFPTLDTSKVHDTPFRSNQPGRVVPSAGKTFFSSGWPVLFIKLSVVAGVVYWVAVNH